jgi:hypothetical protein
VRLLLLLFIAASSAHAQMEFPLREVGAVRARASFTLGMFYPGIRSLSNGRLLVNDPVSRRVLLLDSTLAVISVPFDSAAGLPNSYGPRSLGLIPFRGDTTYVAEPVTQTFLVLDGSARVVRVDSSARTPDFGYITAANFGFPRFDDRGRLIYRAVQRTAPPAPLADGTVQLSQPADSAPIVRMDFTTGAIDTVARFRVWSLKYVLDPVPEGVARVRAVYEVLPNVDEWTVLPDGTVAVVRGTDYHIDWFAPDGTRTSTPPMAIYWRRMVELEKQNKVDSARAAYQATQTEMSRARDAEMNAPLVDFVSPETLPDFVPPVATGAVTSDLAGNVWILPSSSTFATPGRLTYDVINRRGQTIERVRLPENRVLAGFGEGGTIYMVAYDSRGFFLERARRR